MGAAPQTRTHPAQHRPGLGGWGALGSHSSYCTIPRAPSSTRTQQEDFGARSGAAHLGHSLQVPAGDDGPAAVPAGKGQLRRAGLLSSTSASPGGVRGFLAGIAAAPSPQDADGESQSPAPGASLRAPPPSASHPGSSRAWHRGGERDGTAGERREAG